MLVQRRGYHAFSYADLAKAVGITTASIHYHFPSKEDLVRAVVERYRVRFREGLAEISAKVADPLARVQRYGRLFRQTFASDGRICVCASLAADALTLSAPINTEIQAFFQESEDWVRECLDEAAESGALRSGLEPGPTARAIVSSLEGSMLSARVRDSGEPIEEMGIWLESALT